MGRKRAKFLSLELAPWWAGGLIIVVALAVYATSFSGVFVFDDQYSVIENRTIRTLWPLWNPLWPEMKTGVPVDGRPILNLSFAINYAFGGVNIFGYHLVNLGIHIGCGLVLFGCAWRTLRTSRLAPLAGNLARPLALVITLLWVAHPLQTESVTYISQRAESLAGLFYLLTLYCFIRGTAAQCPVAWQVCAVLAALMGMASKETVVSAPLIVFLYDRTFVAGTFREAWRRRWKFYLALASTWLLLAWLMLSSGSRGGTAGFGVETSSWEYALTQCHAVVLYLRLVFWPYPLIVDYGDSLIVSPWQVLPQATILIFLVGGTVFALWRWPAVGFAACWFFFLLAPTSSVVPVVTQTIAEHRMYLALVGVISLVVLWSYGQFGRRNLKVFFTTMGVLILIFGFLTARRNLDYRSSQSIWADVLKKLPDNARALNNFGITLLKDQRLAEAEAIFQKTLKVRPDFAPALNNLGLTYGKMGNRQKEIDCYAEVIKKTPQYTISRKNLGCAFADEGRLTEALEQFRVALLYKPDYADVLIQNGVVLGRLGRVNEALAQFESAVNIVPRFAPAYYNLGLSYERLGSIKKAVDCYRKAINLDPEYSEPLNNLANVLSSCPDGQIRNGIEAVTLAEKAVKLTGAKDANKLDTLACAYAEMQQFDQARRTALTAVNIAEAENNKSLVAQFGEHLESFKQGRPWRESALELKE